MDPMHADLTLYRAEQRVAWLVAEPEDTRRTRSGRRQRRQRRRLTRTATTSSAVTTHT